MRCCICVQAVARSMAHAQLLVVLTAAQPADLLLLQPGSQDQLKQVETAIPLHAWQMHSAAQSANWQCSSYSKDGSNAELHENTGTVGKAISGRWQSQLRHHFDGFKLLDWLISCTSLENDRNLCFAAIFWAAYVIGVGGLGSWCAGMCWATQLSELLGAEQLPMCFTAAWKYTCALLAVLISNHL